MGTVYLAEHIGLGLRRAIKFLRPEIARHASARKRFLQEARVVASLRHEHILEVVDLGEFDGSAYYVMELLEGEDLRALLRRERTLPWPRVRAIMLQICAALRAAHERGVIHRDLKPDNCFRVRRPDGKDFIKLLDFGIAKVSQDQGVAPLTATGEPLGTAAYMALEQHLGQADFRSDIYALGVMLYEMLAGRLPYEGSLAEIVIKLSTGAPPLPLRALNQRISPEIEHLVMRAMALRMEDRFEDIHALTQAIEDIPDAIPDETLSPPVVATDVDVSAPTLMATPEVSGEVAQEAQEASFPHAQRDTNSEASAALSTGSPLTDAGNVGPQDLRDAESRGPLVLAPERAHTLLGLSHRHNYRTFFASSAAVLVLSLLAWSILATGDNPTEPSRSFDSKALAIVPDVPPRPTDVDEYELSSGTGTSGESLTGNNTDVESTGGTTEDETGGAKPQVIAPPPPPPPLSRKLLEALLAREFKSCDKYGEWSAPITVVVKQGSPHARISVDSPGDLPLPCLTKHARSLKARIEAKAAGRLTILPASSR